MLQAVSLAGLHFLLWVGLMSTSQMLIPGPRPKGSGHAGQALFMVLAKAQEGKPRHSNTGQATTTKIPLAKASHKVKLKVNRWEIVNISSGVMWQMA